MAGAKTSRSYIKGLCLFAWPLAGALIRSTSTYDMIRHLLCAVLKRLCFTERYYFFTKGLDIIMLTTDPLFFNKYPFITLILQDILNCVCILYHFLIVMLVLPRLEIKAQVAP